MRLTPARRSRTKNGNLPQKCSPENYKKMERTATSYDYGREGKLLRMEAESHNHKGESEKRKIIIVLLWPEDPSGGRPGNKVQKQ